MYSVCHFIRVAGEMHSAQFDQLCPPQKTEIFFNARKDDLQQMVYIGKMTLLRGDIISLHYANVAEK